MRDNSYPYNLLSRVVEDMPFEERKALNYEYIDANGESNLEKALESCTPRERFCISKFFVDGETMESIGNELDITKQRVNSIINNTIKKLKFKKATLLYPVSDGRWEAVQMKQEQLIAECIERIRALDKAKEEGRWEDVRLMLGKELDDIYYQPLSKLNLNHRAYHYLTEAGIRTVRELCSMTKAEILALQHMGVSTLRAIEDTLYDFGLRIKK